MLLVSEKMKLTLPYWPTTEHGSLAQAKDACLARCTRRSKAAAREL